MKHFLRRIPLKNMMNLRDLGGYACEGGSTRFGVLFRSDVPADAEAALALRDDLGITDVVDLRSQKEKTEVVNAAINTDGLHWHDIALFDVLDPTLMTGTDKDAILLYRHLIREASPFVCKAVSAMALAEGGALVHCSVGKDRTGIITALLLSSMGVADADVIADYEVSYTYMKVVFDEILRKHPEAAGALFNSHRDNMEDLLLYLGEQYGGAKNYLLQEGLPEETLEALQKKFVEKW